MEAIKLILFSLVLSLVYSLNHESTSIKLNQKISAISSQNKIKFFDLKIEDSKNQDLLIDARTVNSKSIYESPIVMISSVNIKIQ